MLLSTLVRAAGGFGRGSHPCRALTSITHRTLFYPSSPKPSPDSASSGDFPAESRAHVSKDQFNVVLKSTGISSFSNDAFHGLINDDHKTIQVGSTPPERWEQMAVRDIDRTPPDVHAGSLGRTVMVRKDEGVGQAYAKLQAILRSNNVRKELKLAERHEKRGTKRRRLRSERWRRKFADEVRKKVKLVTEIRLRDRMWGARH